MEESDSVRRKVRHLFQYLLMLGAVFTLPLLFGLLLETLRVPPVQPGRALTAEQELLKSFEKQRASDQQWTLIAGFTMIAFGLKGLWITRERPAP